MGLNSLQSLAMLGCCLGWSDRREKKAVLVAEEEESEKSDLEAECRNSVSCTHSSVMETRHAVRCRLGRGLGPGSQGTPGMRQSRRVTWRGWASLVLLSPLVGKHSLRGAGPPSREPPSPFGEGIFGFELLSVQ